MAASDSPTPIRPAIQAARSKPDAGPMRVVIGSAGFAILSAIASAIVAPPRPSMAVPQQPADKSTGTPTTVEQPIHYIQLLPGQTAPPGAKVIDAAAPTPQVIVKTVPAPAQKPIVVKTTQSGKVVP